MIDIDKKFERLYLEETTSTYHKTLGAAKSSSSNPRICRIWRNTGTRYFELIWAFGCSLCNVKLADERIRERIVRDMRSGKVVF